MQLSAQEPTALSHARYESREVLLLMGTRFEIGAVAERQAAADSAVQAGIAEVRRIEALISSWQPSSQTSMINAAAGEKAVKVAPELYQLIARAKKVSQLTNGAFDITAGGLAGLYRFEGQDTTLPDLTDRLKAIAVIGYENIKLNEADTLVFLQKRGMRIGFGAIGKGYAANRARAVMRGVPGVVGGVVNAAGDLATFGSTKNGGLWKIGIADPRNPKKWLGQLAVAEMAVVTSGDYENYFTAEGLRYSHIIDPRSALPATKVASATVVCADAELADALATSVFVLGPAAGIALIDKLKNVEGIIVCSDGNVFTSRKLKLEPHED